MFNKLKYSTIVTSTIFLTFLLFSNMLFAAENETIDEKQVYRTIVEFNKELTDLAELENISDLIIKGTIQPEKETLMVSDDHGYTKTKVLVTEVLKGDEKLLNKIIVYREPYFEKTIKGVSKLIVSSIYVPAVINEEYILFLNNYTGDYEIFKDAYTIAHIEKGKYPVNNNIKKIRTNVSNFVDNLSNKELCVGSNNTNIHEHSVNVYKEIYKSIVSKYILNNSISNTENINISNNKKNIIEETVKSVSLTDNQAINKNGNTFVPISSVAELLNCKINWNAHNKTALVKKDDLIVEFPINQNYYILNGNQYNTSAQTEIYNNKTFIPLSIVNEIFDTEIVYDSFNNTIILTY